MRKKMPAKAGPGSPTARGARGRGGGGPERISWSIVVALACCWFLHGQDTRGQSGAAETKKSAPVLSSDETRGATAIIAGLEWLRRHQEEDGSWSCLAFPKRCTDEKPCTGLGEAVFDPGVTGLALLAFMGAGYDAARPSPYLDTIRGGLKFLLQFQDADGCYGQRADNRFTYSQACATRAMIEAWRTSKQVPWRKSAERALEFIYKCQNPRKAWRYGEQPGDNDASVTGWMVLALESAKEAGLPVKDSVMKDAVLFVDSITDEDTGRTGYMKKGELPVRLEGQNLQFPPTETESLTAVGICVREAGGVKDSKLTRLGAGLLAKKRPLWDEKRGSIDMDYWYFGTLAMSRLGGEPRARWSEKVLRAILDHQVGGYGCARGSWDPKDPWGTAGGRIYATAILTMCLEVELKLPSSR